MVRIPLNEPPTAKASVAIFGVLAAAVAVTAAAVDGASWPVTLGIVAAIGLGALWVYADASGIRAKGPPGEIVVSKAGLELPYRVIKRPHLPRARGAPVLKLAWRDIVRWRIEPYGEDACCVLELSGTRAELGSELTLECTYCLGDAQRVQLAEALAQISQIGRSP